MGNLHLTATRPGLRFGDFGSLFFSDTLASNGRVTPNPLLVLCFSAFLGVLFIGLYRYADRFGMDVPMFKKEGFAENLTFLLDLWAAVLCTLAAIRTLQGRRFGREKVAGVGYWLSAALLFTVAMEEISWGQQLVAFRTPAEWSEVNLQQEMTLHNLASRETLTSIWSVVAVTFAVGALVLMVAARVSAHRTLQLLAPHPALAPLALMTGYAGIRVHPEMAELLIAVFFAFYGYRVYVASPAARPTAQPRR